MEHYLVVLSVTGLAVISPGADFVMVSRNSCLHGRRAGVLSALGIAVSCWVHVGYALFLLAGARAVVPGLLLYVRIAGALYLAHVGLRNMRAGPALEDGGAGDCVLSGARSFASGFLTNVLNPKTALFVVSLYTQVIGPGSTLGQALVCGAMISLLHLLWFALVACALSHDVARAWVLGHAGLFNRVIGGVLLAVAVALLVTI
ncbi:putative threonine efflux protein [Gluconacetobacter sacchari DSM 12717]|uniref:LysE family transporter n=2 Tax=Gluconacetobacter sacchari TaxID=92759 RepID=A0A7W4IEJ5_9PROT|nr:LysE family transporter [Gluconacetobacter sacchari]MBB2161420.1 LysE family transporter [Gluconacetobacter sacchari]GBQ26182.1 putative threonine efflux protein [Gluconacetobacter sacchari DSM 12717]